MPYGCARGVPYVNKTSRLSPRQSKHSVNVPELFVRVPRKDRLLNKVRHGCHDEREILSRDALRILIRRTRKYPQGPLFPHYKREAVNALIQEVAVTERWDPSLLWDGLHCHRHGAATELKKRLLVELQKAGSWKSAVQAAHYSRRVRD
jgi:hypothetical protein